MKRIFTILCALFLAATLSAQVSPLYPVSSGLATTRVPKTTTYTVLAGDRGKIIETTSGTFTINLTAAATLKSGYSFSVFNSGSGTITIDPAGVETVQDSTSSATTKTLTQGQGAILICNGTGWLMMKFQAAGAGSGDVLIANNLSEFTATAATARTNLGLAIGTNVQAFDADLTTYAGITPAANTQTFLAAANYAAMKTQLALTIGTDVQAFDADLTYLAGFTPTANVKSILNAADYAAIRSLLADGGTGTVNTWTLMQTFSGGVTIPWATASAGGTVVLAAGEKRYIAAFTSSTAFTLPTPANGTVVDLSLEACNGTSVATFSTAFYRYGEANSSATTLTPSAGNHKVRLEYVNSRWTLTDSVAFVDFAADAGASDTYTATLSPPITAYGTAGTRYRFKANTANTGAATINFNAVAATPIVKYAGGVATALADNDIRAGQWVDLVYDGTNMQMQSVLGNAGGSGSIVDEAYSSANFNGDTTSGVSQDDLYDQLHIGDADDDGKIDTLDASVAGLVPVNSSGVIGTPRTITAGSANVSVTNGDGASGNPTISVTLPGGSSGVTTLSADVTNNNGTANTIADVTALSFAVTSGTKYKFRFVIPYTSAATTTGSRWSINGPTVTLLNYTSRYTIDATTATTNYATAYDIPAASNASSLTAGNVAVIEGVIIPSASGTVIARFASEITASAIVAKAGAYVEYGVVDAGAGIPSGGTAGQVLGKSSGTDYAVAWQDRPPLIVALSDETTAITTGTAKVTIRAPKAMTITGVRASVNTVSSSGIPTVDINEAGTTILSTKLTIDASELTSTTAATAAVISDTAIADDAEITFDIDVAGTGAKGLKVAIYYY